MCRFLSHPALSFAAWIGLPSPPWNGASAPSAECRITRDFSSEHLLFFNTDVILRAFRPEGPMHFKAFSALCPSEPPWKRGASAPSAECRITRDFSSEHLLFFNTDVILRAFRPEGPMHFSPRCIPLPATTPKRRGPRWKLLILVNLHCANPSILYRVQRRLSGYGA